MKTEERERGAFGSPIIGVVVIAAALLGVTGCSSTEGAKARGDEAEASARRTAPAEAWEHERSDIPVDPRIHFGHLDNGLRWAWAANVEPKDRCYLRLHVDVGSLAEQPHEQGIAHFLEHMAFNGSEHFPAGTLIEWFQENGMSFGADLNASTGFSETIYKLDLPDSDEETLREGLRVLRDFADGLLLASDEIDKEKGVIDGEQRERDSADFRAFIEQLETRLAGTRFPERIPIGKKEVRDEFSAESVRAFYERWYRPDNMTLVAVGDLGATDPSPLFEEYFADMLVPAAALPEEPDTGTPDRLDHAFAIHEEELPVVNISFELLKPWEEEPVTVAELIEDLPLSYAHSMINLRFTELAKKESAPFLGAGISSASEFDVIDGESLGVACAPERWEEALAVCEKELRRALQFGFQQAELDEVRADVLRALDEAVEREPTAHSGSILREILAAAEDPYVPTDAATNRAIFRPVIEALTVEACAEALRTAWGEGEFSIYAKGNLDLGEEAGDILLAAFRASAETPVEAGEEIVVAEFAYVSDPAHRAEIVSRERIEDLDFEMVRFANGVAINVKRTDFKENNIQVTARFGEGKLSLDPAQSVVDWVGGQVFNGGGLEAHSEDDLRRITAGRVVGAGFSIAPGEFSVGGSTTAEDLTLQCELMCAYLRAPGWREDGLVQLRRAIPLYFEQLEHQHGGPVQREFFPALFSNDPRYGLPTEEAALGCDMDQVRAWLAPQLADGPIEVTLVGDLDVENTIEIAGRTFGALPPRREGRRYEEHRTVPAPLSGLKQEHTIETQIPKSLVMIVFPLTDGIDPDVRRRFEVLKTVVNDRLRIEVREKLGAAYSPGAGLDVSTVHEGVGMLMIQAMSDPEKVDTLVEACLGVADSLARDGVTTEEADRLREPILNGIRDSKRRNGFWTSSLSEAHRRRASLDEVRSLDAFYEGYTAEDITPLAAQYLPRERASVVVVNPKAVGD